MLKKEIKDIYGILVMFCSEIIICTSSTWILIQISLTAVYIIKSDNRTRHI